MSLVRSVARSLACTALLAGLAACVQPVHPRPEARGAPPGDPLRVIGEEAGSGAPVIPGDLVTVDLVGRYGDGTEWGRGPFTFTYTAASYPGASGVTRVGARYRLAWNHEGLGQSPRRITFEGERASQQAWAIRRDRGPVVIEHHVTSWCRPMKLVVANSGVFDLQFPLGCWRYPRFGTATAATTPAPVASTRAGDDSALVTAAERGSLQAAALLGHADRVGALLRRGTPVDATDSTGVTALVRLALGQLPDSWYDPAREAGQLAALDTLLAHGASVAARVPADGELPARVGAEDLVRGVTALDLVSRGCADPFVRRLLAAHADARGMRGSSSALIGAAVAGCPETVAALVSAGAPVDDPEAGRVLLERVASALWFLPGHVEIVRQLLAKGAPQGRAREILQARLADPGPGGFGFHNRAVARQVLAMLR